MGKKVDDIFGLTEVKETKYQLIRALIAEWLGTLLLVFFGCGAAVAGSRTVGTMEFTQGEGDAKTTETATVLTSAFITQVSLTFGLIVAAVAQAIGHVSGGHINPAVTIGVMVSGQMSIIRGILYQIAQYIGGILGALLLKHVTSGQHVPQHLGANGIQPGVTALQGFLVEFIVSFLLVLVVFGCCDTKRSDVKGSVPLAIGLTVAVCHLLSIGYTGAGMNPARSLAPLLLYNGSYNPQSDWIYFVGPYLGGTVAGLFYTFIFRARGNVDSVDFQ